MNARSQYTETALRKNENPLNGFRDCHAGARCFVVGNGPSLAGMPLGLLAGEWFFCVNRGYLAQTLGLPFPPYYVVADPNFYNQYHEEIRQAAVGTRLYRENIATTRAYAEAAEHENAYFYPYIGTPQMDEPGGAFSTDFITQGTSRGGTVLLDAIQIAFTMGFAEVYVIGCDLDYDVATPYFYNCADYESRSKAILPLQRVLDSMRMAEKVFSAHGRKLINCTVGGKLETLPRMKFEDLFPPEHFPFR